MNSHNLAIAALVGALAGCGAQPAANAGAETQMDDSQDATSARTLDLPDDCEIRRDAKWGTIRFAKSANLSAALDLDPEFQQQREARRFDQLALTFLARHRGEFRLEDPASELAVLSTTGDELGLTHVRLEQRYAGLPVADAQLIVHLDGEGRVTGVGGAYRPTPSDLDVTPTLSADEARDAAARDVGIDGCPECPTELVILAADESDPRLAYRVDTGAGLERWQLTVAADNGEILRKLPTALQGSALGGVELQRR